MGVSAFFRWLTEKYPKIVSEVLEKRVSVVSGNVIPLDLTQPNPNDIEYDNLYVDMNGLIHPCSHPEDREAPSTEAEMYVNVTKYIDRLFAAVRPRRLLYLAIDGVAPRAKMNQQRSRRFRAARDAAEQSKMMDDVLTEMEEKGMAAPGGHGGPAWDSNVITPGTEFMSRLTTYLHYYILDKMNKNEAWRRIKVILSDASEPGEGEHKIIKFVRDERSQPDYDPNQRHVLHGLDADLIMLALATHELHFNILREKVFFNKRDKDNVQGRVSDAQKLLDAQSKTSTDTRLAPCENPRDEWIYNKSLEILQVSVLREYLYYEFVELESALPFQYDFERVVDDFIFLCFFVGNDFLPHLPSLDIRDGALDFLMEVYRDMLPSLGDFLTRPGGDLNLRQVDVLLGRVGEVENDVFQRRKAAEDGRNYNSTRREHAKKKTYGATRTQEESKAIQQLAERNGNEIKSLKDMAAIPKASFARNSSQSSSDSPRDNKGAAAILREAMLGKRKNRGETSTEEIATDEKSNDGIKKKTKTATESDDDEAELKDGGDIAHPGFEAIDPIESAKKKAIIDLRIVQLKDQKTDRLKETVTDEVKFHEEGWKKRYYEDTYKKEDVEQGGGLKNMCIQYVKGLAWVLKYYYDGCPSWNWYYPFHYAPFASDLVNIESYPMDFELSIPFRPVEQLLAVLPKESSHALPENCQWLMTEHDSPIVDLYNGDVPLDPNGKSLHWLWLLLLPFVDESRIVTAYQSCAQKLTLGERRRNAWGKPIIFLHKNHDLSKVLTENGVDDSPKSESDEEVLKALQDETKKAKEELAILGVEEESDDVAAIKHDGGKSTESDIFIFSCRQGNGISGKISAPSPEFHVQIGKKVIAPQIPKRAFQDVAANNVRVFTFEYPDSVGHKSSLLPDAIPEEQVLTQQDAMNRRVPRLMRGGASIVDLAQKFRPKNQQQNNSRYQGGGRGGGGRSGGGRGGMQSFQQHQHQQPNQRFQQNTQHGQPGQQFQRHHPSPVHQHQHHQQQQQHQQHQQHSFRQGGQQRGGGQQQGGYHQPPPPPSAGRFSHQQIQSHPNGQRGVAPPPPQMNQMNYGNQGQPWQQNYQPPNMAYPNQGNQGNAPTGAALYGAPPPPTGGGSIGPAQNPNGQLLSIQAMREEMKKTMSGNVKK